MKICSKCKAEKSLADFSKKAEAKDGLQYYCKGCERLYKQSEGGKESDRKYRLATLEKKKAQNALNKAVAAGKIERPDFCESCFQEKFVYGHHEDYDKPLDVDWLCKKCHVELHKKLILV